MTISECKEVASYVSEETDVEQEDVWKKKDAKVKEF